MSRRKSAHPAIMERDKELERLRSELSLARHNIIDVNSGHAGPSPTIRDAENITKAKLELSLNAEADPSANGSSRKQPLANVCVHHVDGCSSRLLEDPMVSLPFLLATRLSLPSPQQCASGSYLLVCSAPPGACQPKLQPRLPI